MHIPSAVDDEINVDTLAVDTVNHYRYGVTC